MGCVIVVGSYIAALVLETDRFPVEGETVLGRNYHETHGGKGSNMAAAAARLGAVVSFVGKVGDDPRGRAFFDLLRSEGVASEGVLTSRTRSTGTGVILFSSRGTNAIVIDRGANEELAPSDILKRSELFGRADVIVSPLEIPFETARAAAELVGGRGGKAILNPAPAQDLRGEDLSVFFALTPNETEARVCLGLDPSDQTPSEDLARGLLAFGVPNVIITLGSEGVLWASSDGIRQIPALAVNAIDVVGAGDAFNAGLAVGLAENQSTLDSICLGITAASLSTERRETIESYPRRTDVDRRLVEVLDTAAMQSI